MLYVEFCALSTDVFGKKFMRVFDVESEAFLTKTDVFDMTFRKNTFSQLRRASKSFVKTYVAYAAFDVLSNGIV